ncbi:MAG: hypothetical protein IIT57_14055, partial [Treponema sp.]|nr:hypothetical protein [Treponema sp.]
RSGYATLPIGRMTQENPSVDFLGYCRSLRLLHATKPRIHALVTIWQVRVKHTCKKNPSVDFFMFAEAKGFCMLLSRASMRLLLFGKKEVNIHPWIFL